MNINDIVSISLGIVFLIAGIYFNHKVKQVEKQSKNI